MRLILTRQREDTLAAITEMAADFGDLQLVLAENAAAAANAVRPDQTNLILAGQEDELPALQAAVVECPAIHRPILMLAEFVPAADSASSTELPQGLRGLLTLQRQAEPQETVPNSDDNGPIRVDAAELRAILSSVAELEATATIVIQGGRCVSVGHALRSPRDFQPDLRPGQRVAKAFSVEDRRAVLRWLQARPSALGHSREDDSLCATMRCKSGPEGTSATDQSVGGNQPTCRVRLRRMPISGSTNQAISVTLLSTRSDYVEPAAIKHLTDTETGLPNREAFTELVRCAIRQSQRQSQQCAVLICKLSAGRRLNPTELSLALQDAAIRLRREGGGIESMARLGPLELGFLFVSVDTANMAEQHVLRLRRALQEPIVVAEQALLLTTRCGTATYAGGSCRPTALIRRAEREASAVSTEIGNREASHGRLKHPGTLEKEIEIALSEGQFRVFLQPIIHLESFDVRGAEALVRWQHP